MAWLLQIPWLLLLRKIPFSGKSTSTRPLTHTFSTRLPLITHSWTHSQLEEELLSASYQVKNGDQDDAHEAWLIYHSLHIQKKTFVFALFLHHHTRRSSIALPKIPKIHHRADETTRHHRCSSDTVCSTCLTYAEFKTDLSIERLDPSPAQRSTTTSAEMNPLPCSTGKCPSWMTHLLASQEERSSMR